MVQFNYNAFFSKFPTLEVGNFVLRDLRLNDDVQYYELFQDYNVAQYLSDEDVPTSIARAQDEIKFWGSLFYKKNSIFWAIAEKHTDQLIGTIGFNSWNIANNRAEISYDLASTHWRRGIMTQVLTTIMHFAFTKMAINRIEAKTMLHNEASGHLLKKMHFKNEGILSSYRYVRGEYIDVALYALLKEDWNLRA